MTDYLFNKIRYDFFAKHLAYMVLDEPALIPAAKVKALEWIVKEHHIGYIADGSWIYNNSDRDKIIKLAKDQLNGIDLLTQPFPDKASRLKQSELQSYEKHNAFAVSKDYVLVNALSTLCINGHCLELGAFDSLGMSLDVNSINSVQHKDIILVENLSVMAHLKKLVFTEQTEHLKKALWVYRGDIKSEQSTGCAYTFFRRFQDSHRLICFADFDPEGLKIGLTCDASHFLAPSEMALSSFLINGADQDYFNQDSARAYLQNQNVDGADWQRLYKGMQSQRKTIKQEHIISHQIPLLLHSTAVTHNV